MFHSYNVGESSAVIQQLDFGGGCGVGVATDGGERLKELAAQVEDLTYQLSTSQEELQTALERAEHAEVRSCPLLNFPTTLFTLWVVHSCVWPHSRAGLSTHLHRHYTHNESTRVPNAQRKCYIARNLQGP